MSVAYFAKFVGNRYEVKVVNGYVVPDHEDAERIFHMSKSDVEGDLFLKILEYKVVMEMNMNPKAIQLWMCDSPQMQEF